MNILDKIRKFAERHHCEHEWKCIREIEGECFLDIEDSGYSPADDDGYKDNRCVTKVMQCTKCGKINYVTEYL